jgi:hypothetical protein
MSMGAMAQHLCFQDLAIEYMELASRCEKFEDVVGGEAQRVGGTYCWR